MEAGNNAVNRGETSAPDLSKLSLNAATFRKQWRLSEFLDGCARHGIRGIGLWHDQIAETGLPQTVRLVRSHSLTVTTVCRAGFFTAKQWREESLRAIEQAHALRAKCLVVVSGGLLPESKDLDAARELTREGIARILPEARQAGVPLAIEPLHPMQTAERACINTLEQALDLCDLFHDGMGVVVDAYNVWWDPELEEQIRRAGTRILAYQISDWLVPTRDLTYDRGMMGDGVIDLPRIRAWLNDAGYEGFHEVEIFSERDWWQKPPDDVLAVCKTRYATRS